MAVTITVDKMKEVFLEDIDSTDYDAMLTTLIDQATNMVVNYLDDEDITGRATIPAACEYGMMKQIAYMFRRRKDPGLSAVTFPDGTVNKFGDEEFLDDVRQTLDRYRTLHFGG